MSLYAEIAQKILKLDFPVYQADLAKILGIKHDQRVSEAIRLLINEHKISRHKVKCKGYTTYLIKLNGRHKPYTTNPCWGCSCDPDKILNCQKITDWALNPI